MNILSILVCIRWLWLWLGGGSDYTIDSHPQPGGFQTRIIRMDRGEEGVLVSIPCHEAMGGS